MSAHPAPAVLLALVLAACGDDGVIPHPPPVVINVPLKLNQEVVCVESRFYIGMPFAFPMIRFAKRVWTCDLRDRPPRI